MVRILILITIFNLLVDVLLSGYILVTGRAEVEYAALDSKFSELSQEEMEKLGVKPGSGNWRSDISRVFSGIFTAAVPVILALLVGSEDVNLMSMALLYMISATPVIYYKTLGGLRWDHGEKMYADFREYLMVSWFSFFKEVFLLLLYITMFAVIAVN